MKEIKIKLLLFGYKIGTQCLGRGGQTTVQGQKSARQDIFKCLLNFFEKLHLLNSIDNFAILDRKVHT